MADNRISVEIARIHGLYLAGKISRETAKFMLQSIGPRLEWRMIVEGW